MRIALYHNLPSGGAKRAVYEVARRLALAHTVDVFTLSSADLDFCDLRPWVNSHHIYPFQPLRLYESPLGRLNQLQRARDIDRLTQLNRRIAAEMDSRSYDVVFVHPCRFTQSPTILNDLRTPTVYYCHEPLRLLYEPTLERPEHNRQDFRAVVDQFDPLIRLYRWRLSAADNSAILSANRVLANSQFSRANVRRIYGVDTEVCYLGVDTDVFYPVECDQKGSYLLSVGALLPNKGYDFLIRAISRIPMAHRPPLWIVANFGTSAEHNYLSQLAASLDVSLQIETGVELQVLVQRYQQARLVVYAPIREPFGFVPLEAMACGTAVVGVAEGGVLETILDGQTGRLIPRDPEQFAVAVTDLLATLAVAAQYGCNGRAYVQSEWTWDASTHRIEQVLWDVASGSKA